MGFDDAATEYIVLQAERQVLELVLMETPSRQSQFLEIAFAKAVKRRTLTAVRSHKRSVRGHIGEFPSAANDEDAGEETERPIELAPDGGSSPEAILIEAQDEEQRRRWLGIAYKAVKNRKHLKAVLLRFQGMPVTSNEGKPNLVAYFKATPGQVRYWIETALEQMREALAQDGAPIRSKAIGVRK
jgi:hypothetical protein